MRSSIWHEWENVVTNVPSFNIYMLGPAIVEKGDDLELHLPFTWLPPAFCFSYFVVLRPVLQLCCVLHASDNHPA